MIIDPTMSRLRAQLKELKNTGQAARKVFRSNSFPSPPTAMEADASLTSRPRTHRVLSVYSLPSPREDAVMRVMSKEENAHSLTSDHTRGRRFVPSPPAANELSASPRRRTVRFSGAASWQSLLPGSAPPRGQIEVPEDDPGGKKTSILKGGTVSISRQMKLKRPSAEQLKQADSKKVDTRLRVFLRECCSP